LEETSQGDIRQAKYSKIGQINDLSVAMAYISDLYSLRAQKLPPYKLVTGETQT
jgi:hypothetical protein